MHPSPAEITRTLATGRLTGTVRTGLGGPLRVRHATVSDGTPLLLVRDGGSTAAALACEPGDDVAALLCVDDVPPLAGSPTLGRLWLSGWATALVAEDARDAALAFAAVNPAGDLLAVGEGYTLYRLDVAEVRLERRSGWIDVDLDAYAAAEPDPVAADEAELLGDLDDHHRDEVAAFAVAQLSAAGHGELSRDVPPRMVRLDRYGMAFTAGENRFVRLGFDRPLTGRSDLITRMRPLLGMGCACPRESTG
ncbi:DUF2470 domain-containing protein [Phytomonospora sp. NPDC050363]|uniref:DUF2470 domain-containing protein n=1 Tax=Phytomonospora sp. NPDC050363 TaxID=3155642 RepID=UPI0033F93CC6